MLSFPRIALGFLLLSACSAPWISTPVQADETVQQVALSAAQKQQLVKFLKDRLARHSRMDSAQIIEDFATTLSKNSEFLEKNGLDPVAYNKLSQSFIDQLKRLGDAQAILALEKAEIHSVMSSQNYMYGMTRLLWTRECGRGEYSEKECLETGFIIVLMPITIVFDTAVLPITFIGSLLSGF